MGGFSSVFSESFNALTANDCGFSDSFSSGSFNTCEDGEPEPQPEVAVPASAGGRIKRRRYLLPDNTLVYATQAEIVEILEQFVEVEKPKNRKERRKAKHEPFVPIEIEFVPMLDFSVQTYKPVLPPLRLWKPDLREMRRKAELLKRRIDDEEAILLLL